MTQRLLIFAAAISAVYVSASFAQQPAAAPNNQKSTPPSDPSAAEIDLIRAQAEKFVAAFNDHDAKAVAALWTEDGEFVDDSGRRIVGREAIEKDYSAMFAENPDVEINIAIDSLRLVADMVAIETGRAIVQPPPPGDLGVSNYTATHVKAGGEWLMASVRDEWKETQVTQQSVADLGWLIGTWAAEEHGATYETICKWVCNESFVQRDYTTTQVDGTKASGVQLIGWNPLEGYVQSWSFSPDGGHDFGIWSPVHDGWRAEMRGVTGAGVPTTSVNLLRRLDENAYVWQSVQRWAGDVSLPDTDEVVIKRQTAAPANEPAQR